MEARPRATPGRMLVTTAAIAGVFALAGLASIRVQREAQAKPEDTPTIAVLPFETAGRKDTRNFADGMSEEIASKLASLHGLRVIGREGTKSYTGSARTPQQIASELGVQYVLTGAVRWDNSEDGSVLVRVSASLVRSNDASQVWAEAYQTVLPGMFAVQAKVAARVANALDVSILTPEREALNRRPTGNLEAYDLYIRARHLLENPISPGPIRESIAYLEKATSLDENFTLAWSLLSVAHTEYFQARGDETPRRLALARAALDHAASLDPESPEVHLARGILLYHGERDYPGALRELGIAEKSRPNDYTVHTHKGAIARRQGDWEGAIASQKRSLELEPLNGIIAIEIGNTLRSVGRYREAEEYADRGMLLSPESPRGARIKSNLAIDMRGNVPEAIQYLRNAVVTVKPASQVTALLQEMTWPAIEDPSLRKALIDAQHSPDLPAGNFYINKMRLYLYLRDPQRARANADSAIGMLSREARTSPDSANAYVLLALAQAVRGDDEQSMSSFNRSEQLLPSQKDAFTAGDRANMLALIYLLLGDYEATIATLEKRVGVIGGISRNRVRLDPIFAPLRGNPRFERLLQSS